jgi:meso-butanediol dehydrogenase/(S,S)-butanediol dehydrogenase/diacetyl reductase
MQRFENKIALITGAASGIGLATARRLAQEGAKIFACDLNFTLLETEMAKLSATGATVKTLNLNVADVSACHAAVAKAVETFGRIDVLCNIAGIGQFKNFADITQAEWDRMFAVNVTGLFAMTQAAMPHLLVSKGNVINMSSAAGVVGIPYNAAYCASKGAVLLFSKSLATEYASRGVRVNAICPGGVNTPLAAGFNNNLPKDIDGALLGRVFPLTPFNAEPEEIAAAIAYIASDEARFVTGIGLSIDGGQTGI